MRRLNIKNKMKGLVAVVLLAPLASLTVSSCIDADPDSDSYYTFTGEMMSDYLRNRPEYSQFTEIVNRAGIMDLLSTYGHYTCFAPKNDAVGRYLTNRGLTSVDQLTDADCDTIARTHLVNNMYSTFEMNDGVLPTPNMLRRVIEISNEDSFDEDGNPVVTINRMAHIYFAEKDDSVENGIMQPVSEVLVSSNSMITDILKKNDRISLFYEALVATGLRDSLFKYNDPNWEEERKNYPRLRYTSHVNQETATVPDTKQYGFTIFVEPDSILRTKYGINSLEQLYQKACEIYDATYPEDAGQPYHDFSQIQDRRNPLNRFVAYHILTRDVQGWNFLTPLNDIGIMTDVMNPVDWYETMLPHTMMKFERLTVLKWVGTSKRGERYINRRYDNLHEIPGVMIERSIESQYDSYGLNGRYFYVDDLVAFSTDVRDKVQNMRIRMDFSTIWPELMSNPNIRQNGNPGHQDPAFDETAKYGRNYYFPNGYLDGVTLIGAADFVYRRPHDYYDSYEGDELNLFGQYDFTFRLPPVPFGGQWQIRMGYAQEPTRGVAQIYFDGKPQGIPLDMTKTLTDNSIMGNEFSSSYSSMSDEEKAEDQKALKNKGYYRGAMGGYRYNGEGESSSRTKAIFGTQANTFRIVFCTVNIDPTQDHYLRIRNVGSKQGNNNEFMMDYLELVPKSVFGVTDDNAMEDDL